MAGEGAARHVVLDLRADPGAVEAAPPPGSGHDVVRVRDEGSAVDAVRRAASGRPVMVLLDAPSEVGDRVLRDLRRLGGVVAVHRAGPGAPGPGAPGPGDDALDRLPADCVALLELLATGLPLGEAAGRLHLARRTADRRLALARRTLGVATTAEAVLRVVARSRAGRGAVR
jgi:hypothetical protein